LNFFLQNFVAKIKFILGFVRAHLGHREFYSVFSTDDSEESRTAAAGPLVDYEAVRAYTRSPTNS